MCILIYMYMHKCDPIFLFGPNANDDGDSCKQSLDSVISVLLLAMPKKDNFQSIKDSRTMLSAKRLSPMTLIFAFCLPVLFILSALVAATNNNMASRGDLHILPNRPGPLERSNVTLREFLLHPDGYFLGMAPSFFGFYGYFGALAAWEDELSNSTFDVLQDNINGVAGASAGAMAAILLAAGIPPQRAAEFCSTISLTDFADFPGLFAIFRGNKFEKIMYDFMKSEMPNATLDLEDASLPIAVSGFDIQTMRGHLLQKGSMARAARASACFPFLFQPVGWIDGDEDYLFVDGGISDVYGMAGLAALHNTRGGSSRRRAINLVVRDILSMNSPGPSQMPENANIEELLSISIHNLPPCGPLNMKNGPRAVEAARQAMRNSMDVPLFLGTEKGHLELHIDAFYYTQ
jgi:Patatin-like phospholipase